MQILQRLIPFSIEFPFFVCFCWKSFLFCLSERRLRDYGEADSLQKDNDQDVKWRVCPKNVSKWYCNFHTYQMWKLQYAFLFFPSDGTAVTNEDCWSFLFFEQFLHWPVLLNQGDWGQGLSQQVPTSPLRIHEDHEYWGILMMRKMMLMLMVRMEGHNVDSISKPMLIKISPSASFHQGGSLSCKEIFIRLAPDINGPLSKLNVMYHEHQMWKHYDGKSFGIDHLGQLDTR